MYHLSGISSLTNAGRSRSNSLASSSSSPLSPSVLDFSEYVSRQCEKKLQRRVRLLTQKCNNQQTALHTLRQQLKAAQASRAPLSDRSNQQDTATPSVPHDTAEGQAAAEDTADESDDELEVFGSEQASDEQECAEEEVTEEGMTEGAAWQASDVSNTEDDTTAHGSEVGVLDESIAQPQAEGQPQMVVQAVEEVTAESVVSPPCSPISAGRHKRTRTDDSEQCNTEAIDAHWKKAKEADVEEEEQSNNDQQTAVLSTDATLPTVAALLPFKPVFLHRFPTSHAQLQGSNAGSGLTPYRGLLRPFPLAQLNQSPVRIPQPAL